MIRKIVVVLLFCLFAAVVVAADGPPMTAEELVARHLAAIGTPEARAAAKSRGVNASAHYEVLLGGAAQNDGTVQLGSDGRKAVFVMRLNGTTYIGEKFVTDGDKVEIAPMVTSKKTILGRFFLTREEPLKEGLFGGVLTTAWPLLDTAHPPKLRYTGLKTIDGRQLHELRYETRKNAGDTDIRLYFDPETCRHVMTIYTVTVPVTEARTISPSATSQIGGSLNEGHQVVRESFSDFKAVDGLQLPTNWTIDLSSDIGSTTNMHWDMVVQQAVHTNIDPAVFRMR